MRVLPILVQEPIFSTLMRFEGKSLPKVTDSGLCFAENRPKTQFLRDFIETWLSVELAGASQNMRVSPILSLLSLIFPQQKKVCVPTRNIGPTLLFPGFALLENDQKRTFA